MAKTFDRQIEVSVPQVIPPGVTIIREVPVRVPEIAGDVFVPFLWASISGLIVLFIGLIVCAWQRIPAWWPLLISGIVVGVIWFWLILKHWHKLWIASEDTSAGTTNEVPKEATVTIEAITQRQPYIHVDRTQLPIDDDELQKLADGIMLEGKTFAEELWCGKGNPFSKARYHRIMSCLHQGEYVQWRNEAYPTQGRELTVRGQLLFQQLTNGEAVKQLTAIIDAEGRQ